MLIMVSMMKPRVGCSALIIMFKNWTAGYIPMSGKISLVITRDSIVIITVLEQVSSNEQQHQKSLALNQTPFGIFRIRRWLEFSTISLRCCFRYFNLGSTDRRKPWFFFLFSSSEWQATLLPAGRSGGICQAVVTVSPAPSPFQSQLTHRTVCNHYTSGVCCTPHAAQGSRASVIAATFSLRG